MSAFRQVLHNYLMIDDIETATKVVNKEFKCSRVRKDLFLAECKDALADEDVILLTEDQCMDYIDGLRRAPYQGMGI